MHEADFQRSKRSTDIGVKNLKKKKMGKTEQEKGERHLSPSRRTKDEANNGKAFSEAEVAGRSIFSPASMQPREREGGKQGEGRRKGREERRDEC